MTTWSSTVRRSARMPCCSHHSASLTSFAGSFPASVFAVSKLRLSAIEGREGSWGAGPSEEGRYGRDGDDQAQHAMSSLASSDGGTLTPRAAA